MLLTHTEKSLDLLRVDGKKGSQKSRPDFIRLTNGNESRTCREKNKSGNPIIIAAIVAALGKCDAMQSVQEKSAIIADTLFPGDAENLSKRIPLRLNAETLPS